MSMMNDESLLLEFVTESREHLSSIEPDLLILEREGENAQQDIINRVFRAIHSIKGASGFFGLEALKNLSHSMENILMMVRDGKMTPNPRVMDPLLVGVDRLNVMLDDIQASEDVEYKDIVTQLEGLLVDGGAPAPSDTVTLHLEETATVTPNTPQAELIQELESLSILQPEKLAVESAVKQGQHLFLIQVFGDVDLDAKGRNPLQFLETLMTTGVVLDTALDISGIANLSGALKAHLPISFLYASVLEGDLLALSLDIPNNQVHSLAAEDVLNGNIKSFIDYAVPLEPPASVTAPAAMKAVEEMPKAEEKPKAAEAPPAKAAEKAEAKEEKAAGEKTKASGGSKPSAGDETVRVKVELLNKLMDLAGEMVLARNQLVRALDGNGSDRSEKSNGLNGIIQNVDLVTSDLQEHIMQTRMQPIASVFGKFPRVVRDLAKQLGKEIELHTSGDEVELDKSILESLSDPLTHLVRNSCDHALEKPDEREAAGKTRGGSIYLRAYQESGHINIAITDDGRGIDYEKIAAKALKNGLLTEADLKRMSPQDQVNLIFLPGFSMAEKITDVSGRGVGMDVVRTNIEQIGGSITIETELGTGTTILLRLPLTLAIIPSLVVGVGAETFAIPQINLVELVSVSAKEMAERVGSVGTAPVLKLRGNLLPLVNLSSVLEITTAPHLEEKRVADGERRQQFSLPDELVSENDGMLSISNRRVQADDRRQNAEALEFVEGHRDENILVLKSGNYQYGLIVDDIHDMEEIVVKPLSNFIKGGKCFSGATIMGDGRVAMILDVSGIVAASGMSFAEVNAERERLESQNVSNLQNNTRQSVILFNSAPDEVFAIPLSSILRLEKFETKDIEHMGSGQYLSYRGKGLRLVQLEEFLPVASLPTGMSEAYLIIPKEGDGRFGIMASKIIDTLDTQMVLDKSHVKHPSVSGSAIINNHLTLFIEPNGILESLSNEPDYSIQAGFPQGVPKKSNNGTSPERTGNDAWQPAHLQLSR